MDAARNSPATRGFSGGGRQSDGPEADVGDRVEGQTILPSAGALGRQSGERPGRDGERSARSTLRELKNVAEWFGNVRGRRKAILFVSEGIDYDIMDVFNNRSASTLIDDTRDTIAAATKANVSIYGIDPRGLTTLGDESIEVQSFPDDTTLGIGQSSFRREIQLSQDSLRELSDETGLAVRT
jgi:hypothetical protein